MLFERINVEFEFLAIRGGDRLGFQIDGHAGIFTLFRIGHQNIDNVLWHHDGQDTIFERVVEKDVGKRC